MAINTMDVGISPAAGVSTPAHWIEAAPNSPSDVLQSAGITVDTSTKNLANRYACLRSSPAH